MFSTIFKHELKYWFRKPAFYIYGVIFFLMGLFFAAGSAGILDSLTVTTGSALIVNSPLGVMGLFIGLSIFMFFLFPSIIGVSIYRDFKTEMHTILYSYPFTKLNYLFAKFFSSVVVVTLIVLILGLGMVIGFRLPGTNSEIVGSFQLQSYVTTYFIYILPNVLLFGAIVFAVVTFTRNIAAGFIVIIILIFGQGLLENLLANPDNRFLAAILDPFGAAASNYYTRYWTVAEQNELHLPVKGVIIYNRLLWLAIAGLIFGLVYKFFSFSQNALTFSFRKQRGARVIKSNFGGITKIDLPKVTFDYSLIQNLKATWQLSNVDFKYILKSWPFISIVIVGLIIMIISLSEVGNLFGTATLPMTWKMLSNGSAFAVSIMIATFLYAGMLVHRAKIENVNQLLDTTPIPNWALLLSKFIALLKMQFVLLTVIMLSGIIFQVYHGHFDFEIGHYVYELYILRFIQFGIWAMLALFIQTLFRNPYLGLFVLIVILIGFPLIFDSLIEQDIFKFNKGPGYSYSDMNGYGNSLPGFFLYKLYWFIAGCGLLICSYLFWVRGIPHSFKERLSIFRSRFKGYALTGFAICLVSFLTIGSAIYYSDNIKEIRYTAKEQEQQTVDWEKTYKQYEHAAQPRIVDVKANVHIYPKTLDFKADGCYIMVNKTERSDRQHFPKS